MNTLFFDTETTGLPKNYNAPMTDADNWPRLVQLAWILCDATGRNLAQADCIVKPDGWTISESASAIHGITTDKAIKQGIELRHALAPFISVMLAEPCILVAHNINFDFKIVGAEFMRLGYDEVVQKFNHMRMICTMKASTDYVAIKSKWGYKWPKLQELHRKLFAMDFKEAHNAAADIEATVRCYFELVKLNVIKP